MMMMISSALIIPLEAGRSIVLARAPSAAICVRANSSIQMNGAAVTGSGYLTVDGIRIHYLKWGQGGPALVLLHGLYDDARVWISLAPLLSTDHYVIAPDRRGAGGSDLPQKGYDPETLSRDVTLLIQQLKLGPVTLIGHSAGAEIALRMAATHPRMIRSLVMIDGGFWPKRDLGTVIPLAPEPKDPHERALLALENSSRQYDPEMLYGRVSCPALLVIARQVKPPRDLLAEYQKRGIDYFDQIRKAEQHAQEVADKSLLHGRLVVIEDTGHWIQKDQPSALEKAIRDFLTGSR
jgi:pimeloyl-ACP methyl ester carboxylesterase